MDKADIEKKALLLDRRAVIQVVSDLRRYREACRHLMKERSGIIGRYEMAQDALNDFETEVKEIESSDLWKGMEKPGEL